MMQRVALPPGSIPAWDGAPGFHNYGVLWTPTEMIFEVDGEPVAALVANNAVKGPHRCRFFQRAYLCRHTGPSGGHDMVVKSPRNFALQ
jgi:hypothetical protein